MCIAAHPLGYHRRQASRELYLWGRTSPVYSPAVVSCPARHVGLRSVSWLSAKIVIFFVTSLLILVINATSPFIHLIQYSVPFYPIGNEKLCELHLWEQDQRCKEDISSSVASPKEQGCQTGPLHWAGPSCPRQQGSLRTPAVWPCGATNELCPSGESLVFPLYFIFLSSNQYATMLYISLISAI